MATKKYVWKFDLEEYLMTKDVKEDFAAKVKPIQTFYMADVARLIAEERTEYRIDTIVNITKLVEAKIRQLACGNNIVVTDNVQYSPGILGLFLGKTGVVDPAKNKAVINMIATAALRAETDLVTLEFSGVVRDMGGANISLVKDVTTGKTDGTVTPGGILDVTGSKIRSVNADGTGLGLLTLVNTADLSVATTITLLAINDPKRLMFNIPADLAKGSYQLTLEPGSAPTAPSSSNRVPARLPFRWWWAARAAAVVTTVRRSSKPLSQGKDLFDGVEPSLSMLSNRPIRWRRSVPFDGVEPTASISPGRQTALPAFANKLK